MATTPLTGVNQITMDIKELEHQLHLLNSAQEPAVPWATVALQCFVFAEGFLNKQYDYHAAITWFKHAVTVYEQKLSSRDAAKSSASQTYIGLAMSYHHIGKHGQRDECMVKAQTLLAIPNNIHDYTKDLFARPASSYFVVDGYRFYIKYEDCHKSAGTITQQEQYLRQAQTAFEKALEIANTCGTQPLEQTHAHHGLGTIFEFLSKCQQEKGNVPAAQEYLAQSIDAFEQALSMRRQLLGEKHPHVARSYHKLARNYALLGNLLKDAPRQELYQKADNCYQQAIRIFEENYIAKDQPKRQELDAEYENFKKTYAGNLV